MPFAMRYRNVMKATLIGVLVSLVGVVSTAQAAPYDMRGEWSMEAVCQGCAFPKIEQKAIAFTALLREEEGSGNFSGTTLAEGLFTGTMSGTVVGTTELSASIAFPSVLKEPLSFILPHGTIEAATNAISGAGTWEYGAGPSKESGKATFVGRRLRTLAEVEKEEQEIQEKIEKEEKETTEKAQHEQEAREQKEKEEPAERAKEAEEVKQKEAAALAQYEKEVLEQRTRFETETKEAAERATRVEQETKAREAHASGPATLVGKTFALGGSGSLSLKLSNPNGASVSVEVVLLAPSGHASKKGKGTTVLGKGSFTLSSHGTTTVKLELSHSALAELAHHHTLQARVRVTTDVTGRPALVSSYTVTVHGSTGKHH
jgi:outer membrane biosynthesis protein TonB